MANITEILGTDSISSSRLTINSNFTAVNDEIADLTALVDPVTSTISGIESVSAESLNLSVVGGGSTTQILSADNTGVSFGVAADFSANINIEGAIQKSGVIGTSTSGSTASIPTSIEVSTYFTAVSVEIPAGTEGQELTIINTASVAKNVTTQAQLSVTGIELSGKFSTVTLRYIGGTWFVIGSHNIAIVASPAGPAGPSVTPGLGGLGL